MRSNRNPAVFPSRTDNAAAVFSFGKPYLTKIQIAFLYKYAKTLFILKLFLFLFINFKNINLWNI